MKRQPGRRGVSEGDGRDCPMRADRAAGWHACGGVRAVWDRSGAGCSLSVQALGVKRGLGVGWERRGVGGARVSWIVRSWCAQTASLISVHDPAVRRAGDMMVDGVVPLGEALRPLCL